MVKLPSLLNVGSIHNESSTQARRRGYEYNEESREDYSFLFLESTSEELSKSRERQLESPSTVAVRRLNQRNSTELVRSDNPSRPCPDPPEWTGPCPLNKVLSNLILTCH